MFNLVLGGCFILLFCECLYYIFFLMDRGGRLKWLKKFLVFWNNKYNLGVYLVYFSKFIFIVCFE